MGIPHLITYENWLSIARMAEAMAQIHIFFSEGNLNTYTLFSDDILISS